MTTGSHKKKEKELTVEPPKPILTLLLVCMMPIFLSNNHTNWLSTNGFTALKMQELQGNFAGLMQHLFTATFAQLSPWVFVLNAFFVWMFGSLMERQLIGWRYPMFIMVGIFAPWFLVSYHSAMDPGAIYIGPSLFLLYMVGGYMAYLPKKPFKPQDWVKPSWKIFREDASAAEGERIWVSPWIYVTAFAIFQVVLYLGMSFPKDKLAEITHQPGVVKAIEFLLGKNDAIAYPFTLLPGIESMLMGAMAAFALAAMYQKPTTRRPGGALQVKVLQHYRELRALDMTHDQAVEGAAKFSAVPVDIAKDWIAKGAAALKEQKQQ